MGRFPGLIAATFTPMREHGAVDLDAIPPFVEHLVAAGVHGLFVCGSTGEGESLTPTERREVAAAFVAATAGRLPVIVQVGTNSLGVAAELTTHAVSIGADAIAAMPPSLFKPDSVDTVVAGLREIAAAASGLPLYYYHVPQRTGVHIDVLELLRAAAEQLPSLAGVKFSALDICTFQACVDFDDGRFDLLWGSDELLLAGLGAGATGAVGTTYCYAASLYQQILHACSRNDLDTARRWQSRAVRMIDAQLRRGGLPAFKATMAMIGVPCGPVRSPLRPLTTESVEGLRCELEQIGFFEW